jgi:heptosyltransferase I
MSAQCTTLPRPLAVRASRPDLFRPMSNPERIELPPRDIAIVMLSALGDAVHVLPVANALRRAWPDTRITWIIQPVAHGLVKDHPAIDEFIVFRRRRGAAAWRSYSELGRALVGRRFDLLLALQVYLKAGLITAQAPAKVKLGFDRARARDLNWAFTTHRIPPRPVGHVQDQYFEFLHYLGVDPEPIEWRIEPTTEERAAQAAFFERIDRPVCTFIVATSKPAKNWAPEHYARVIDAVEADFGMRAVIAGGPSAAEAEAAARITSLCARTPLDARANDVRRLVWLLGGSALVVSPDTGPLHLARALDVPVVGLYGYTNPKRYGPYRKFEDLVVDGYARSPGEDYVPSMQHRADGMQRVTVEQVLEKIERALAAKREG